MKVFDSSNTQWDTKVNFVDLNNVVVGYDMSYHCCENAGWSIRSELPTVACDEHPTAAELEPYYFDRSFTPVEVEGGDYDGGGSISWRLVAEDLPPLYLTLFNSHNGYYSHGFTLAVDGATVREGDL